ncbi:NTP transferase domain-containing protein [Pelagibacteraceae bacterium]|jgi:bifunctional N-acetylglucosamine-1-phosphate-uridyltransferase/glucosamine-1-phosphate-acetyltransferase GlmU-like protein|nr:NTP transferase domain-containing protein [Pelagibacteraceae bacterium]
MIDKNITFIIPAAGKSSRFKSKKSKIFYNYKKKALIQHVVEKCLKFSNRLIIVVNKKDTKELKKILFIYTKIKFIFVLQNEAKGMGHAISIALRKSKTVYTSVIWSDQTYLLLSTIRRTISFLKKNNSLLCFPIYNKKLPYAYILRDSNKKFKDIVQTREGGKVVKIGESDCGFFIFKTFIIKKMLQELIEEKKIITNKTKEIDFLQAFKFFKKIGNIDIIKAGGVKDTIGINTIEDLI